MDDEQKVLLRPTPAFLAGIGGAKPQEGTESHQVLHHFRAAAESVFAFSALKKTAVKKPFVDQSFDDSYLEEQWRLSCQQRIRNVDEIRKHAPLPAECQDLNIPDDRLSLLSVKDILFLCGGCVGVTFSTEEFSQINSMIARLKPLADFTDSLFQKMSASSKKRVLVKGPYFVRSSESGSPDVATAEMNVDEEDKDALDVIEFHRAADAVVRVLREVQVWH